MEQMTNIQDQLNQILNGQPGELLSAAGTQAAYGALAAAVVVGLLVCFFGLKLVRILGTLMGFFAGAAIGAAAGLIIGLEGMAFAGIVLGAGIVFGLLSWFLYRVGVFLLVLAQVSGLVLTLLPGSWISAVVALAAGIIVAILSVIYVEPFVIIVTGIYGGLTAGTNIAALAGLDALTWSGIGIVIGAVIAVIGIIVQFMMHSRKVGKKERNYSKKVKEQDSMESEVEKARHLLDDDDDDDLQD